MGDDSKRNRGTENPGTDATGVTDRLGAAETFDPRRKSISEIEAERNRVLSQLSKMGRTDPNRPEREAYVAALDAMASRLISAKGAGSGINLAIDSFVRIQMYVNEARRMSQHILEDVRTGRIAHEEARRLANRMRNDLLQKSREKLTPGGRAISRAVKEEGMSLGQLLAKYSEKIVRDNPARFGLRAADLSDVARVRAAAETIENSSEVSRAVIEAAGRTNEGMTLLARLGQIGGPAIAIASIGSAGYQIYKAQPGVDRARVIARETGGFAGGWIGATTGGVVAGWGAGLVCVGSVGCAVVVSIVIVPMAVFGGGRAGEWLAVESLTAFTKSPVPAATLFGVGGGYGGIMQRDFERAFGPAMAARGRAVPER